MRKIIFAFLIFIAGCATSTDFEMLKGDVNQLKKDSYDIKKDASETRTTLTEVKEKYAKEEALNAIRESETAMRSDISGISKDLQTLTGRFDEYKHNAEKSSKDKSSEVDLLKAQIAALETQIKDLQSRLYPKSEAEKLKGKAEAKTDTKKTEQPADVKAVDTKAPETKSPETKDPVKIYESAYNAFREKKYKEAREKFEVFVKEFPKDNLASNAQFWIAETYYAEEDYAGAIVEYDSLLKNYPDSKKITGALLKQGYSFFEMGDRKAAKGILEQLREKYPKSKEAELAKKKIEEISKKGK